MAIGEKMGIEEEPVEIPTISDEEDAPFVPDEGTVSPEPDEESEDQDAAKDDSAAEEAKESEGEESEESEDKAADEDSGGEEADQEGEESEDGFSDESLMLAGKAGLTAEQVAALGTEQALMAAIEIKQAGKGAETQAKDTESEESEDEVDEMPELPAWDVEVPEELTSEESAVDPKVGKFLKDMVAKSKEREEKRDEIYRAEIGKLKKAPKGDGGAVVADMIWNLKLDKFTAGDTAHEELLGDGLDFEVTKEQYDNRLKLRAMTEQLYSDERKGGANPKIQEVINQAFAATFPKEHQKIAKGKLKPKLKRRAAQRISKPTAKKTDTRTTRKRGTDKIKDLQERMGITGQNSNEEGYIY